MARSPSAAVVDGRDAAEWRFDALDLRPVERWLAQLPLRGDGASGLPPLAALARAPMRLHDRYLDTEDFRIRQAGLVLRIRRRGRQDEATLRPFSHPDTARTPGHDITQVLVTAGHDGFGVTGPVGSRVHAVIGRRPLHQVLEVRTRRRSFSLRAGGEHVAELTLDDTIIAVGDGGRPVPLRRVRIRIPTVDLDAYGGIVGELRTSCGLRTAQLTKFDTGLLALGVPPPGPPDLGPTAVSPASTLGDLAFAVIRRQLVTLASREPGTRLGEDPEELHDMRVATRRLRAALELFADVLPARAQVLRSELGWLAGVLGSVRDLDVQLERMDEMQRWAEPWADHLHAASGSPLAPGSVPGPLSPLESFRRLLERDRAARRRDLLDTLDSPRWERLWSGLATMARQGPARRSPAARAPAVVTVPGLVTASHRSVMRAARRADRSGIAEDFHRLRIRCKRLRYMLEFTSELYAGRPERLIRRMAGLQNKLGLMQDAEVATLRLMAAATGPAEQLAPSAVFAMGGVAERYRAEAATLLAGMAARLQVLKRREWTDLAKLMESRRREALPAPAPAPSPSPSPGRAPRRTGATEAGEDLAEIAHRRPDSANGVLPANGISANGVLPANGISASGVLSASGIHASDISARPAGGVIAPTAETDVGDTTIADGGAAPPEAGVGGTDPEHHLLVPRWPGRHPADGDPGDEAPEPAHRIGGPT